MRARLCALLLALLTGSATADGTGPAPLWLDGAAHRVPATLVLPDTRGALVPAVVLLHGTGSQRDGVGGLFARLAQQLAVRGIASLRIDFAGTGDSPVDYRHYTPDSAVADARTALDHLVDDGRIDAARLAVLGFSQGGLIAQLLAADDARVAALVTWSTAAGDGVGPFQPLFERYEAQALRDGAVEVHFPWRTPLRFDRAWFVQMRAQTSLSDIAAFRGPLLAIAGDADTVVPPSASQRLVDAAASPDATLVRIAGADHIFNVLDAHATQPGRLLGITADWLAATLAAPCGARAPDPC